MRHKYAWALCMLTIIPLLLAADGPHVVRAQNRSRPNYQLTIYVDEGRGELNGHVFFGLSDGRTTIYQGWHSLEKLLAPLALGGGQVWNDGPLAECGWDVKKTYDISPAGYERARRGVVEWNTEGRAWAINHHCGDFVETIAQMAGAPIKLPERATGRNRPELFGDYLRSHGGELSGETFYVNGPIDTRTSVKRGDKIRIRASGLVMFGRLWAGGGGPDGVNNPFISPEYNRLGMMSLTNPSAD
jgi:hypothetical protein